MPLTLSIRVLGRALGGVPVVFVHSFAGDTTHWPAQLEHLRKTRRAVAFDLRGHGQSAAPVDDDYSVESMAGDIAAVVDGLGIERFALVGHSMGGAAALIYAGKHPERVAGLVLAGAPGKVPAEQARQIMTSLETDYEKTMESYWSQLLTDVQPQVLKKLTEGSWHHPSLWGLLPERTDPLPVVPEWPEFIRGCVRYRQSLDEQAPNAPRTKEPHQ